VRRTTRNGPSAGASRDRGPLQFQEFSEAASRT
jgi:hypothetical protein